MKDRLEPISELEFSDEKNNDLKKEIVSLVKNNDNFELDKSLFEEKFKNLILETEKNLNFKNILLKKDNLEKQEMLDDLIQDLREMNHQKQIEFLEKKVAKNLDESSYFELIKLKSQLNME